jgi:hypothetical protein
LLKAYFGEGGRCQWIDAGGDARGICSRLAGHHVPYEAEVRFRELFSEAAHQRLQEPIQKARACAEVSRFEMAADCHREAIRLQPRNGVLLCEVSQFLTFQFRDPKTAADMARTALTLNVTSNTISIATPPGLVSLIIPCCGMLDYTKLGVPSVLRHSREPFALLFLDTGSRDGTAEYLAGLRDGLANRVRVEVCRAAPEGQRVACVPYRLGPRKAARPGEPLIDVGAVEGFARDHHGQMRGKWIEIDALAGFCLLIRREVLSRIRPALAKWTDLSPFDTDIAGKKARQEGFSLVVCCDLFIHHFGTRTFAHGAPATEV